MCCLLRFDLKALPVDFVECLMRFLPTEAEVKVLRQYERERRPLDQLAEEDRFMLLFSKIERLTQRMNIITFVGNFADNVNMLTPQLNAIIAASGSVKSSPKMKRMLEVTRVNFIFFFLYWLHLYCFFIHCSGLQQIILALGNYMNSSKRGCVYGFKLQSLDLVSDKWQTMDLVQLPSLFAIVTRCKCAFANNGNAIVFCYTAAGHQVYRQKNDFAPLHSSHCERKVP